MLRDLFSLFPACAGVIQDLAELTSEGEAFPRMCGGDPQHHCDLRRLPNFSPHVRG